MTPRFLVRLVVMVLSLTAGAASAFSKDAPVWAAPLGAKLRAKPSAKAPVTTTLAGGEALTWLGSAPEDRHFQKVRSARGEGYVLLTELAPRPPVPELQSVVPPDSSAFATQGYVKCHYSPEGVRFGGSAEDVAVTKRAQQGLASAHAVAYSISLAEALAWPTTRKGGQR